MVECKTCKHKQNLLESFCHTCFRDFPLATMSADPRYCPECYDLLMDEASMQPTKRAAWMPRTGSQAAPSDSSNSLQDRGNDVSELAAGRIIPVAGNEVSFDTKEKHPGGRPRKQDGEPVSRMTAWRRKREAQGVLL